MLGTKLGTSKGARLGADASLTTPANPSSSFVPLAV